MNPRTLFPWTTLALSATVALSQPVFSVSFPASRSAIPLDGRILLCVSTDSTDEPRFEIDGDASPSTQQVFGVDVDGLAPGTPARISDNATGFPLLRLADVPRGRYRVQAVLHRYETFHRSDGHTIKLPMDRGEGQQWNRAPGNLYSAPRWVDIGPAGTVTLLLDHEIPPITPPQDTKYIRHVRIRSALLSTFWGRDMYLGANVLLPFGFDEHPRSRYPLILNHGHFSATFHGFREAPPDTSVAPVYSERFRMEQYNIVEQQYAHEFYKEWTGPHFPRFVIIEVQHANPFFDDSYAVNSANVGPYGDAIMKELVPFIEKKFRCIGAGWARFTYGGSTGGWEALAAQVFYPDAFNGCFAACPDPIDFRAYTVVDIYADTNAYYLDSYWKRTPRPGKRDYLGHVSATLQEMNQLEFALGTHSRSGSQWDIWQAVYSPVGKDGYPRPIWDKATGTIDHDVAAYWRDHYDLGYIIKRDWASLGPHLAGKIHIYCGDMDSYYLNDAVYLVDEILKNTSNPFYDGDVAYGDRAEHCWNGDQTRPNGISRLRYHQMYVDKIVHRLLTTAPAGADTTSWRY